MAREKNIENFNEDVRANGGYRYTQNAKVSSTMANARISLAVERLGDLKGKRILDVGCGDGTYTQELLEMGASYVLGVDAAADAVQLASERAGETPNLAFRVMSIEDLRSIGEHFDVAVVRGLLHHLYEAGPAAAAVCDVADEVIVVEPNGYNPVLKVIEKVSKYHVEHEEKSYSPRRLDRWFESEGAVVQDSEFIGLVPMFCPDTMARTLKRLEPLFERVPFVRAVSCAQYVQRISTRASA